MLFAILLLSACGAPEPTAEPFPARIAEVEGLTVDDVQAIWRFDDSSPQDTPARIVYREQDLKRLLEALQAVRLTGLVAPAATVAPGDYLSYRVFLFSGKTFDVWMNSTRVISQGKNCSYENIAPVQQVIDGIAPGLPHLLGTDAYETVEQVKVVTAAGEHTVTDRKQIQQYVRMFDWMQITGRSRESLADGSIYTFRYKNGEETVLKYKGNLLAMAQGMYHVTPNPEYMVVEVAGK